MLFKRHQQHFFKFFEWERDVTPLSSPLAVGLAVALYLLTVAVGRWAIKRPLYLPRTFVIVHNFILCFGSLIMFAGAAHESYRVRSELLMLLKSLLIAFRSACKIFQACLSQGTTCDRRATGIRVTTGCSACLPEQEQRHVFGCPTAAHLSAIS